MTLSSSHMSHIESIFFIDIFSISNCLTLSECVNVTTNVVLLSSQLYPCLLLIIKQYLDT